MIPHALPLVSSEYPCLVSDALAQQQRSKAARQATGTALQDRSVPRLMLPDRATKPGPRRTGRLLAARLWTSLPEELNPAILVIALRGNTLAHRQMILHDMVWLHALGARPVLVHDGGPAIAEGLTHARVPPVFQEDQRVIDARTLSVMRMVLCGQINQDLVTLAAHLGGKAIGLCGADGQMVRAHVANPDLGFVGAVHAVNPHLVELLCAQGYLPIIAPLGQGPEGTPLALDGDAFAAHLACALDAQMLVVLGDATGVQRADGSLIPQPGEGEGRRLLEAGAIPAEQISSVSACLGALIAVPRVHLAAGREPHVLLHLRLNGQGRGTRLIREPTPATAVFWELSPPTDSAGKEGSP